MAEYTSNGGGATHIAKVTGQLKDLSSNLSDILLVSGGGGGGLLVGETAYTGKEAGGISGSGDNSADQSTGNAFGQGESGTNVSGGGSGLYGGYKGTSSKSGGAGSGYIGNSLVSNKKMVGYNVPTSSSEGTKTESVNVFSGSGEANKPKAGNGMARIKFLREVIVPPEYQTYIDIINGSGFFWKNYSDEYDIGGGYKQKVDLYPYKNYSYCPVPASGTNINNVTILVDGGEDALCYVGNIYNVNITSSQGTYSVSISFDALSNVAHNEWNQYIWNSIYFYSSTDRFDGRGVSYFQSPVVGSASGTLEQVLSWVAARFRNVNLYVDGVLWSSAGQ